jgi:hypothetical protein
MSAIHNWYEVEEGDLVTEDTYPEVYEVFMRDGERWIRQVGWEVKTTKPVPPPEETERPCDFDPHFMYDQPWYRID